MKTSIIQIDESMNVTLTTYLLDNSGEMPNTSIRPAVLICPGGAYKMCSDREAEPVAMAFLAEGYNAFVLRYSLNENAVFPKPLKDAEAALELIRGNADNWHIDIDKIAVCGFSAGGHLAAALGTMGKTKPAAMILGYPCILDSIGCILANPVPSLEKMVDEKTPPAFIFSTFNDEVVPVENSLRFADALEKYKIPFEMHIFGNGLHGLSMSKSVTCSGHECYDNPSVAKWFSMCITWLEGLGWKF